ncbi:putative non-reducing end alpha-L-arabinofuranosidase [Arabidopsis thaliana]
MEESMNIQLKAREILVSESHEELAMIVDHLFKSDEDSEVYKTSQALYKYCVSFNPGCLAVKLLKLYQSSSDGVLRFRSIYQLSETLNGLRNRKLSLDCLYEIKTLLIACLTMQETKECDIKILRRIVSFVAYNVMDLHKYKWDELGDCILSLVNSNESVKGFHVFIDLPQVYEEFIQKFMKIMFKKATEVWLILSKVELKIGAWLYKLLLN